MPSLLDSFSGTTYFENIPFFLDIMWTEDYIKIQVRSANTVYAEKDFFPVRLFMLFQINPYPANAWLDHPGQDIWIS